MYQVSCSTFRYKYNIYFSRCKLFLPLSFLQSCEKCAKGVKPNFGVRLVARLVLFLVAHLVAQRVAQVVARVVLHGVLYKYIGHRCKRIWACRYYITSPPSYIRCVYGNQRIWGLIYTYRDGRISHSSYIKES